MRKIAILNFKGGTGKTTTAKEGFFCSKRCVKRAWVQRQLL
jgi:MinD superfamily P-loop ATPase